MTESPAHNRLIRPLTLEKPGWRRHLSWVWEGDPLDRTERIFH
jgi:hypothetical protein